MAVTDALISAAPFTANEDLLNRAIRHAILLELLKEAEVERAVGFLNTHLLPDLIEQNRRRLEQIKTRGFDTGPWTTQRLQDLAAANRELIRTAYTRLGGSLKESLGALALSEAEWQAQALRLALPISIETLLPNPALLRGIVNTIPIRGHVMDDWISRFARGTADRVNEQIRIGLLAGETIPQMIQRIRGTRAGAFADGVFQTSRVEAATIVRTSVNHVSNAAKELTYAENREIIAKVLWISTLDKRTTPICQARDGEVFPIDEGPRPPAHHQALAAGTIIRTARGDVPIESVRPGDLVWTHRGRWRPVYTVMGRPIGAETMWRLDVSTGRSLLITDEHPVLTSSGWKMADRIEVGDEVFQHCKELPESPLACSRPVAQSVVLNADDSPSLSDEPFVAYPFSVSCVPCAIDFQRQFLGREGKVDNVAPDRILELEWRSASTQGCEDTGFVPRRTLSVANSPRFRHCDSCRGIESAPTFGGRQPSFEVSPSYGVLNAPMGSTCCGETGGIALRANADSPSFASYAQCLGAGTDFLFEREDRYSVAPMSLANQIRNDVAIQMLSETDSKTLASPAERRRGRAERSSQRVSGHTVWPPVFLVDEGTQRNGIFNYWRWHSVTVAKKEPVDYQGWVWNLAVVEDESYVADSVCCHNCRSTTVPVTKSWKELGVDLREAPPGTRASMNGQVPAKLSYIKWLARMDSQPSTRHIVDEALGKRKAQLWRRGLFDPKKFKPRRGSSVTLQQIREQEGLATGFRKGKPVLEKLGDGNYAWGDFRIRGVPRNVHWKQRSGYEVLKGDRVVGRRPTVASAEEALKRGSINGTSTPPPTGPTAPKPPPKPFPPRDPSGADTMARFQDPKTGQWTKERAALHSDIIDGLTKGAVPQDRPVFHVMGGGPASGKSLAIQKGVAQLPKSRVMIDPNAIKGKLPEYQAGLRAKDPTAASFVHEESSHLSRRGLSASRDKNLSVVLDGTGDSSLASLTKKIQPMRDAGYRIEATYLTVATETAVARNLARAEKTGRLVPEAYVREVHSNISKVLPDAIRRGLFDDLIVVDTNVLGEARVIFRHVNGRSEILDRLAWDRFLAKAT